MARWAPNARERLARAALELFAERGYDAVTVAEIAHRAGLTKRTFFRHFADKREVLFAGGTEFQDAIVTGAAAAPASATALQAAGAGVEGAGAVLEERRSFARQRQAVIAANTELQERELIKLAGASRALTQTLRKRGVEATEASLAAEAAMAAFRVAFETWVERDEQRPLVEIVRASLDTLRTVTAA